MASQDHQPSDSNDLHWMAFRYLADELDGDQVAWFESLLAEDQEAREALASAVELTDTVVATAKISEPTTRRSVPAIHSLWWMTVGAALCFCVMFVAKTISRPAPQEETAQRKVSDYASLAIAWDETRTMLTEQTELPILDSFLPEEEDDEPSDFTGEVINEEPAAPSWMESALLGITEDEEDDEEWEG